MNSWVCLDASIVLKLALPEPDSLKAVQLWQSILHSNNQVIAPSLFPLEITAVLRKHVYRRTITESHGLASLQRLLNLQIHIQTFPDIHLRAWQLATQFNRPTAYDTHYLALAEHLGCEFWTGDERLYNTVKPQLPWVRWLGHFVS